MTTRQQIIDDALDAYEEKLYKQLCNKYHPDKHPPEKRAEAEEKMKEVNQLHQHYKQLRAQGK